MGSNGSRDTRSEDDERTAECVNPYLADSLAGRWLKVARQWLEDNGPCTIVEFVVGVAPLMPTHVKIFRHKQDPQFSAAKEAVGRLKSRGVVREQDGMLVSTLRKSNFKYDHESIITGKTVIALSDVRQSKKQVDALRRVLRARGWKLVAKNTYAKPE